MDNALETFYGERSRTTSIEDNFISAFETYEDEINGSSSPHIRKIRKKAIASFEKLGIPTKRHEEWKYTYINAALKNDYAHLFTGVDTCLTANDIYPFLIPDLDAYIAVVENGKFLTALSTCKIKTSSERSRTNDVLISAFAETINGLLEIAETHFSRYADINSDAFIALNTAYAQDGTFIFVPDGVKVDKPVHIVNIINETPGMLNRDKNLFIQPRNLFVLGKNSQVQIIESFSVISDRYVETRPGLVSTLPAGQKGSKSNNSIFTNAVTEIICGENSNAEHYMIQNECGNEINGSASLTASRISTTQVYQETNSVFSNNTITLNGVLVRNNLNIVLCAEGCETQLYGLYMLSGKQHVDNHTLIDHKKPNCHSNELYIGILDDKSTGVFNGKVHVRKDAQKTNAYQSNKNILLSEDAVINTKPQLEIYADDVKCSHGATTGQLDMEALFYLRSRGIGEEKARVMLMAAFTSEIIDKIKIEPLKHKLNMLISEHLSSKFKSQ